MTALEQLAQFAASAQPDPGLRAIVAPAIADGFGCILAGAESDVAKRVLGVALVVFELTGGLSCVPVRRVQVVVNDLNSVEPMPYPVAFLSYRSGVPLPSRPCRIA